jgi:hypothetical protein
MRLEGDARRLGQGAQLDQLIRRQCLGGEEVERARRVVVGDRVDDRQVVAERLPRSRGRDDAHVPPSADRFDRRSLVRVERLESAPSQGVNQAGIEAARPRRVAWRRRLLHFVGDDEPGHGRVTEERADRVIHRARPIDDHVRTSLLPW